MNTPSPLHTAAAPGHGPAALLASMAHTRLELAAIDLEAHVAASVGALLAGLAALVIALIGFAFVGVTVIAIFWDSHRMAAAIGTTIGYVCVAAALGWAARARWNSRPPAFAAVLHELERDREALRAGS